VETRLVQRYIPTHCELYVLEVEHTDYLPLSGCTQRQVVDRRVSYMNTYDFVLVMLILIVFFFVMFVEICAPVLMFILYCRMIAVIHLVIRQIQ
jgi:hypothetical protein